MVRTVLFAFILVLPLAACGGDDTTATTTAAPTSTTAAPTSTTRADAAGDVVPIEAAPCDLLTADDVAGATGLDTAEGREDGPVTCMYDVGADTGVSVFVSIEDGQGRFSGAASLYTAYVDEGNEMISGVGESAVYAPGFRAIAVDAGGGKYVAVGVNGGYSELAEPKDVLIELATVAVGQI